MNYDFLTAPPPVFSGVQTSFEDARYVVLGVPFDSTSTYRLGARFAPNAIREASLNIEAFSFRTDLDIQDLKIHDLGDLQVSGNVEETLKRLKSVFKSLLDASKTPVLIGGEHTITLGAMQALGRNVAVVSFDAHLDLRNEYLDQVISHATHMRRIKEQVNPRKILEIGTRAVCREELQYAEKCDVQFWTAQQLRGGDVAKTNKKIKEALQSYENLYVTIDLDVLDPAYAPAVQNPESDGLDIHMLLDILCSVCDERVIGFDLVEVSPHYDQGITVIQASKIICEVLCHIEKARRY